MLMSLLCQKIVSITILIKFNLFFSIFPLHVWPIILHSFPDGVMFSVPPPFLQPSHVQPYPCILHLCSQQCTPHFFLLDPCPSGISTILYLFFKTFPNSSHFWGHCYLKWHYTLSLPLINSFTDNLVYYAVNHLLTLTMCTQWWESY